MTESNESEVTTLTPCTKRQTISSVALSPSGGRLAVGTADSQIRVYDTDTGKLLRQARTQGPMRFSRVTWLSFADEQRVLLAAHGRIHLLDLGADALRGVLDRPILHGFDQVAGWLAVGGRFLSLTTLGDPSAILSVGDADHAEFDRVALAPSGDYVAGVRVMRQGYDYTGEELHLYATATMECLLTADLGAEQCYLAHKYRVTAALGFVSDAVALARVEPGCLTFDEVDQIYRQVDLCPDHPPAPGPSSVRFLGPDGSTRRGNWPDGFRPRNIAFTPDAVYGLAHGRLVRMDARTLTATVLSARVGETAGKITLSRSGAVAAVLQANLRDVIILRCH